MRNTPPDPEDLEALITAAHPGPRIAAKRAAQGWTLQEFSDRTGIALSTLSRLGNSDNVGRIQTLAAIAYSFGCTIADLFGASGVSVPVTGKIDSTGTLAPVEGHEERVLVEGSAFATRWTTETDVAIGDQRWRLRPGDTIIWRNHALDAMRDGESVLAMVEMHDPRRVEARVVQSVGNGVLLLHPVADAEVELLRPTMLVIAVASELRRGLFLSHRPLPPGN